MKTRGSQLATAVAVAAVLVVTGCSSSGGKAPSSSTSAGNSSNSSSAGGSSDSTPAVKATGPTVDVWTAAPIGAAGASAPQRSSGIKAAFLYLNDHGGLGKQHQRVVVKVCNTQLTPQGEIQCAAQATGDPKSIAFVSPIIVISTAQVFAALQKAGLPDVNPSVSDPVGARSKIAFPLNADILAPAGCAALLPKAVGKKKIGFAGAATAVTAGEIDAAKAAATKAGSTDVGSIDFPISTSDIAPFVTQLAAKGPEATVLVGSPQNVGQWLAAAPRLGKAGPLCTVDALTPPQVLLGLGAAVKDFYTAATLPDPTWTGYPVLDQFRAQAKAEQSSGDDSASLAPTNSGIEVLAGWVGAQALIQAANNVSGAVTKSSLLAALNKTTVTLGTGDQALFKPVDFSKPAPNAKYPRVFNPTMFLKRWDPAKKQFVKVSNVQPVDVASLVP